MFTQPRTLQVVMSLICVNLLTITAAAEEHDATYCNKYVGLELSLPSSWHLATEAEVSQVVKEGSQLMGLDSPAAKAMTQQMPGKVLIMASKYGLDDASQDFNPNLVVAAIDVRDHRNEISTGKDYCKLVAQGMRSSPLDIAVSEIVAQEICGKIFHKLDVRLPIQGVDTYQRQLARINNDYLVVVNMAAENPNGLDELSELLDGMSLTPVSQSVEATSEAQAFRSHSRLDVSNPSPAGNAMQIVGLVGMAISFIWLFCVCWPLAVVVGIVVGIFLL